LSLLKKYIYLLILFTFFYPAKESNGQFYNGHQMTFGKNRVQYLNKYWKYHRFEKFDTYFYRDGDSLSRIVAEIADRKLPEIENFFGHGLQNRLIFLCYKRLSDFRESNIGYDAGDEDTNIGGVTRIIENKIFVYYEGDRKTLEKQITAGITQVVINDMLYSGSYSKRFTNSSLIELPEWYESGLISYLTEEWNFEIEDRIKDGFRSRKYKRINHLTGEDAKYAGHSFWYFIGETYGIDVIPNIIYLTKINKNSESGFKYVLGLSVKDLSPLWKEFYKERFSDNEDDEILPSESDMIIKGKKNVVYQNVKISPSGRYLAFVTNHTGRYKVKIYDQETDKLKVISRKGHKLDQITDYSYPVIDWHPGSKLLVFFTEEKGRIRFYTYNVQTKDIIKRNVLFFDKILSASYSDDGLFIALSASIKGQTDIFIYNLAAGNFDQVTNDPKDDFDPYFVDNSSKIVFSSYRHESENVDKLDMQKDLYIYDLYAKDEKVKRLTNSVLYNEILPKQLIRDKYLNLTDRSGIINKQIIRYDSTISYIDTAIHYRYFIEEKQVSDYTRNIRDYDINNSDNSVSELIFHDKRYKIFKSPIEEKAIKKGGRTFYRRILDRKIRYNDSINKIEEEEARKHKLKIDSLRANPPSNLLHPDSIPVDINNYLFEIDRKIQYYDLYPVEDTILNPRSDGFIPTFNYLTNFYTNYIVQQVDFGFLNNSYQAFTGGGYYFNPGLNIFTKVGVHDLFEDYRISGAFRLGTDLNSFEYLLSFEDLKYKIDKQFIYHRLTYENQYTDDLGYFYYGKVYSNEFMYILKYPFNQVSSVKATLSLRHDRGIYLSTDIATLAQPSFHLFFSGLKLEYNFDNVRSLGVNLYDGTRFKIFGEYFQEVDQQYTNLFVLGADLRFYKKIHRNLIYAGRFAASSSLGKSKLLYYLGGVDNWYTISQNNPQFDNSVNINFQENYVYQAVATNMRGFIQNARNGTNFFVINNEIRFPVIRYLANRPLNSAFLNNFQIVGFADVGSAWSGLTPADESNAYNTETVTTGPVSVVIDKNRWPVVLGYGAGVRSKLFGYFFRLDWAWGIDNYIILPRVFYFSLSLDF
jgi:hypothetical protein